MITSTILFVASLTTQMLFQEGGRQLKPLTKDQESEVLRQLNRVHKLVKLSNFMSAELALASIEPYGNTMDILHARIEISLWSQDYREAFKHLKLFFEGDGKNSTVSVSGAEELRVWYWFLLTQNGNTKKAEQVKVDLFQARVRLPISPKYMDPTSLSKNRFAQVYMYMAGYYNLTTNFSRSQMYIHLAQKSDKNVTVDPNFEKIAIRFGYKPGVLDQQELSEVIPMLDHKKFEKKTGRSISLF